MQVRRLHRLLSELIAEGHGHKKVMVSKSTFTHGLEGDGVTILPVNDVAVYSYPLYDDDGGDTERVETAVVMFGDSKG